MARFENINPFLNAIPPFDCKYIANPGTRDTSIKSKQYRWERRFPHARIDEEQEQTRSPEQAASTLEPGYWYYCQYAEDYYPSLQSCPDGRQQSVLQSAAQSPRNDQDRHHVKNTNPACFTRRIAAGFMRKHAFRPQHNGPAWLRQKLRAISR